MKQTRKNASILVVVGVVLIAILIIVNLTGNFNQVRPQSSQIKSSSISKSTTSTKKSSEDILDKRDQTESSEPAKTDSFAADQHVTGQEIKLARQDLKRAGIDADKLSDEEISVYIEQAKVEGRSIVEIAKSFGNISD